MEHLREQWREIAHEGARGSYVRGWTLNIERGVAERVVAAINAGRLSEAGQLVCEWSAGSQGGYNDEGGIGRWWAPASEKRQVYYYGEGGNLYRTPDGQFAVPSYGKVRFGVIATGTPEGDKSPGGYQFPVGRAQVEQVELNYRLGDEFASKTDWLVLPVGRSYPMAKGAAKSAGLTLRKGNERHYIDVDGIPVAWVYKGSDGLWYVRIHGISEHGYARLNFPPSDIVVNGQRTRKDALEDFEWWLGRNDLYLDAKRKEKAADDANQAEYEEMINRRQASVERLTIDHPWDGEREEGFLAREGFKYPFAWVISVDDDGSYAWAVFVQAVMTVAARGSSATLDEAREQITQVGPKIQRRQAAKMQFGDFEVGMRVRVKGHPNEPGTIVSIRGQGNAYTKGYLTISFDYDPDRHAAYPWRDVELLD